MIYLLKQNKIEEPPHSLEKNYERWIYTISIFYLFTALLKQRKYIVHIERVKKALPPQGHIGILVITDKQFADMEIFFSKKEFKKNSPSTLQQLTIEFF